MVGTVLVGIPVRTPNHLQVNKNIVRAFAGITNDLVNKKIVRAFAGITNDLEKKAEVPPTLYHGKRLGQSLVATNATRQRVGRLLYVTDGEPRPHFLSDTGTEVSIELPLPKAERKKNDRIHLACSQQTVHQ